MARPFNLSVETLKYLSTPEPEEPTGNLLRGITLPTPDQRSTFFTAECFQREDESDDGDFYNEPRFVTHIDDKATEALTLFYTKTLPDDTDAHLDLCSSWVSFLPAAYSPSRCVGIGMNLKELEANKQLTEHKVQDLNKQPELGFDENSFDAVTNVVSIDYLNQPIKLMEETKRVLKPGEWRCAVFLIACSGLRL